jgi:hypothetical protein
MFIYSLLMPLPVSRPFDEILLFELFILAPQPLPLLEPNEHEYKLNDNKR